MDDTTQLVRAVGRIEGMLTALTSQLAQSHADNGSRFSLIEQRMSEVESKMSHIYGIGAALVVVVNAVSYWVNSLFHH